MNTFEASAYTDRATNVLLAHVTQVGLRTVMWATLVHDAVSGARDMAPDVVDAVVGNFQQLYWSACADAGIRPHDIEAADWAAVTAPDRPDPGRAGQLQS